MAHCIYCGTQNPPGALFCLGCGQTLYREPQPAVAPAAKGSSRWLIPAAIAIGAAVVILIFVLGITPRNKSPQASLNLPNAAPPTAAVLTIIGYNAAGSPEDQGSGFILTSDGLGATNYHVLNGPSRATAECCSGRKFEISSVEGFDKQKDLVVFQLHELGQSGPPHDLPTLALDTSGDIAVGEKVIAIGSPQGLEDTVSDGIVSAIRVDNSTRYLQITAPISPGSSGGPILNGRGQVIGIATMQAQGGQNLNFAVSAEELKPLVDEHLQYSLQQIQPNQERPQSGSKLTASDVEESNGPPAQHLEPFTGQFAGFVHNNTADLSANFALFVQDTGGDLRGCFAVLLPLGGSGPISGSESGEDVTFAATSDGEKITFVGKRTNGSISGNYLVEKQAGSQEYGSFEAKRRKILDDKSQVDFENCPTDAELNSAK